MQNKRGGRVQVNMMQYYELVRRVEKLENALIDNNEVKKETELTNGEMREMLTKRGISFTTRNTKEELLQLLEG